MLGWEDQFILLSSQSFAKAGRVTYRWMEEGHGSSGWQQRDAFPGGAFS